ncbi:unnamed protein product [Durusdinium trenchii]|uniref:EF-hand domain-containing protein n=1 Tax=Durusdinium trenchii TaxID=1381693 RepID=A0ABP0NW47_9DINO
MEPDEAMKAVMEAEDDLEEVLGDEEDAEAGWEGGEGEEMCRPRDEEDEALQLDHLLDEGKFHVGVSWVHLAGLKGKREQYNGMKCLITSFGVRNPALVKVRGVEKNEDGKYIALWVKRIHCRNTVHKDTGAWKATPNPESTGATGAARWVALGRPEVDAMQGKLKFQKTPEEEAQREELFKLIDVNHNGMLSLAEIDKALPDVMGCVALFNAKPAIIRAFLAATERPPHRNDEAAFREHARAYVKPGEQFRRLIQYLHEFFEMYLIFQDMVDADEDRRIDCKEFANFIASGKAEKVGIKVTPEMMEDRCGSTLMPGYSLFNEIDEDQGGCILFKEFSDYCIRKGLRNPDRDPMESDTGKLRDMFHSAKDMDDAISIGRFVEILKKVGIKDGEIDAMIKATDKNHNYKIDVDEFIDWLMADGHHAALKRAERSGTESSGRANDGPPACKNGCGFKAAPGVTRSGKPLDTCCRGCATSGEHDQRTYNRCTNIQAYRAERPGPPSACAATAPVTSAKGPRFRTRHGDVKETRWETCVLLRYTKTGGFTEVAGALNEVAQRGEVVTAKRLFQEIVASHKPTGSVLHMLANTVLKAYAKAGDPIGALDWVQVMRDMNCSFNTRSTGKLLDAAALGERLDLAERFLAALLPAARGGPSLGLPVDQETHRTLALALCRASSTDAYRCLLWSQRWAAVEGSDARCQGAVVYAWELVGEGSSVTLQVERSQGEERELEMDLASYNALADACAKRGDLEGVHGWIEKIQASGLALNEVSFNIVMDAYGQQGRLLQASRWFGKMLEHGIPPNVFSYGTMISACARKGYADEAEEWLLEMWRVALHPLEVTYNALLNAYAKAPNSQRCAAWLSCMQENLVTPSVISYATVIDSFAQTGDATGAVEWFERLSAQHPEAAKTAAHANNAVLAAFARKGDSGGATKWLQEMISRSCLPSVVSYNTLIKSYAKSSSPQEALECLEDMQSAQLEPNLISYNTVIAAYAHAGDPDHVAEVLERMTEAQLEPSVITWTSMINACGKCQPPRGRAAQQVFRKMLESGVKPNKVTLQALGRAIGSLACRRLGVKKKQNTNGWARLPEAAGLAARLGDPQRWPLASQRGETLARAVAARNLTLLGSLRQHDSRLKLDQPKHQDLVRIWWLKKGAELYLTGTSNFQHLGSLARDGSARLLPAGAFVALNVSIASMKRPGGLKLYQKGESTLPPCTTLRLIGVGSDAQQRRCEPCGAGRSFFQLGEHEGGCFLSCPVGHFDPRTEEANTCSPCLAGSFRSEAIPSHRCEPCAPGHFSHAASAACRPCAAGSAAASSGAQSCVPCEPGFYAPEGARACEACPPGHFSLFGASRCESCPAGTTNSTGGVCKECPPGFFNNNHRCEECPRGRYQPLAGQTRCFEDGLGMTSAEPGLARPSNAKSFFVLRHLNASADRASPVLIERCTANPEVCLEEETCAEGHGGRQCFACLPGFVSSGTCSRCPSRLYGIVLAVLYFVGYVLVIHLLMILADLTNMKDCHVMLLKILLNHCIAMTVLGSQVWRLVTEAGLFRRGDSTLKWLMEIVVATDGAPQGEASWFSLSCLMQPPRASFTWTERLATAKHHEWEDMEAERDALASYQYLNEVLVVITWNALPFLVILVSTLLCCILLDRFMRSRIAIWPKALDFYAKVSVFGGSVVQFWDEESRVFYIQLARKRLLGLFWPLQYANSFTRTWPMLNYRSFLKDHAPARKAVLHLMYFAVARRNLQVLACETLGEVDPSMVLRKQGAVACRLSDPLLAASLTLAALWAVVYPIVTLCRSHRSLASEEARRSWAIQLNGYSIWPGNSMGVYAGGPEWIAAGAIDVILGLCHGVTSSFAASTCLAHSN